MSSKQLAVLSLISASIIWGATGPVMKLTLKEVPLVSLAFIRFFAAAIILFPFVFRKISIKRNDIPVLIISAFLGVTLNITLFFWGLTLTSALNSGIIIASGPILLLLFARLFLKDKLSKNLLIGSALGILGILIIIGKDLLQNGMHVSPLGDILILIATLCFVFYQIINKKIFNRFKPITITFYSFLIGSLGFLPAFLFEFSKDSSWVANLSTGATIGIFYGIFLSSLAAYSLWQWGLSKFEASKAGFFFYLDPIASTIAAVIILSEKITFPFIVGAVFIFAGLFIAEKHFPYHHSLS